MSGWKRRISPWQEKGDAPAWISVRSCAIQDRSIGKDIDTMMRPRALAKKVLYKRHYAEKSTARVQSPAHILLHNNNIAHQLCIVRTI